VKKQSQHIIRNLSLEIDFERPEDAFGLQNRIAELFYERLQPALEKLLDEMAGENYLIKLDRLEIDCGKILEKNWEQDWVEATLNKIKMELSEAPKKKWDDALSSDSASRIFLYFLENGYFPWDNRFGSNRELENLIIADDQLLEKLKAIFRKSPQAAKRLAFCFSEEFTEKIIRELAAKNPEGFQALNKTMEQAGKSGFDKRTINAALIKFLANYSGIDTTKEFLRELQIQNEEPIKISGETISELNPETGTEKNKPLIRNEKESDAIYIENSGLVLLHPFFTELFEDLLLVKDNQWTHIQSQQKAVLILQYLVTGKEEINEHELPLNKILCGLELNDFIGFYDKLISNSKTECDHLLLQAIKHWSALKNTGIESFRKTFLKRNGKLSKVDNGWLLQVEHRGVDILLSHLPWGIGIIKTPWMNEVLYVEWT
jgi:hypothetical protein